MDWEAAKKHCINRNWQWSLDLINQAEKEMIALQEKVRKLEAKNEPSDL
ncbi:MULTISPECIES: hypothetical protein [Prochlorococcus]|nr:MULTISPECIES: hypothetical protein [Prochlorococcus]KGG13388.1 hypothetical protein EV04_0623 [Prochlorococcus marinus str. LG]KGG21368.1 hypothetical protein EV08_0776 [Prochlorococcus marinus str. SS2]KGG24300.1 hypothetical protein EV09_0347 [Prochlorococcus marinus str. SS35]KGG33584.1 hypothetical protein EV10_0424 [Prochlorococcus marinus str. SS51]KGG36500.1 hypothetical protein EV11_0872 [Prochlorococcus sp. SS52]